MARASPEMARADLARTDWYPAILLEKVDKVRAEDAEARAALDPVEDLAARADLAGPAVVAVEVECLAGLPVAEAQVATEAECSAGAED